MSRKKPKLAVWKFTFCDGCQLSLLYLEDELLELAECVDIAYFPEASRRRLPGPYDISLVVGSVSLPEHLEEVQRVRRLSRVLIAFGTCATSGGIQALRNFTAVEDYARLVYERPELIPVLGESTPISRHVQVDLELQGCPPNRTQVVAAVAACLHGAPPPRTPASVCLECKRAGQICVLVSRRLPCLGPVTQGGCGALCPGWHRPCYGCFGPKETPKTSSLARWFTERLGAKEAELVRAFRLFYANAPAFRLESEAHEKPPRHS